ncbi:Putative ferredoxin subunit of phenylpropionate dioxygenase [Mycobacteroides abscessus subsp. abscessus]|uniref:non-heme iron oxygenase ferredoxin subunit n=1 Tax=Mycobacteroides abscessus TaxID=36809 RepID=UPI000928E797|nr:non-heme iron oxygenase ferredoxin subunit [Mycobacteroides abscessus]MBN7534637.1 non-heme iron oxygenase ferredoxin subunit [Mycobacteroides abscessus subsp. abscessus]MDO3106452.1 non-heme iron oxygenase ferredoxin subunit [Mycobacteroides abscessus subsp. abscessus]SHS67827.1 Putative ferredoxin subunit of phenylpropionate dioxygenase [Mycobacteroides abscessus subsp. abscessus]SHS77841.1 Putative ferredoxin subunit of phenylpropionate dioxygenase [Mycobacteroides abscessus subsp. absces
MSSGIRVAALEDIPEGEGIVVAKAIAGTADNVALLRDADGSVWALDDTCTHADASLAEGWVEDGYVECPLHSSRFCLKTGAVDGLPATKDTCPHRIEVRDGDIFLFPGEKPRPL